ncbi:MAG: glycoside hydrolase family 15 protein [Phycisphaerales bacterium]|nr:MAG: glycoside hydrolase family 15 protein [Phycisphaerales bacterium]
MPRNIPVGNGEMLVTFDEFYRIRDIYWPHVGMPNHTDGHIQRFGVWADGEFAWIEHESWTRELRYKPDTMVTEVILRNERMGLELICHDAIDYWSPVYFRKIHVTDLRKKSRDVRIFFHHDLSVSGSPVGDTVNYDPRLAGLVHYKDDAYFLINGCDERKCGIDHWATGTKRIGGAEGTWRDAEDGQLTRNAIAQGSVDSTVGFNLHIPAGGTSHVIYWIAAGRDHRSLEALNRKIIEKTAQRMMDRSEAYWRLWACKEPIDFSPLPEPLRDLYVRSQLILRTQIDHGGAIIAANDSDITHFAGDTYSYMWPRDGALVAHALILAGHGELSRRFFRFCAEVISEKGYFLHKYNPTGTLASSWHPWMLDGKPVLPIQQDETALVTWALRQHFLVFRDVEFLKDLYTPLVINPARWMLKHRDHHGLPLASWDLWEERRGVHTFTVAATIGALIAAADFAEDMGAMDHAAEFREGAERMRGAMMRHLWREEDGRFARMATLLDDGTYRLDMTCDAANFAVFAFGALPPDHEAVISEMKAIRERLWIKTDIGGIARYEHDYYHQIEREDIRNVPGNPWVICTLWAAQHLIAIANSVDELELAMPYLEWTQQRALDSGVLAEQFDPYTGDPISVSPLTWSHATVMTTLMQYLLKHAELTGNRSGLIAELARRNQSNFS